MSSEDTRARIRGLKELGYRFAPVGGDVLVMWVDPSGTSGIRDVGMSWAPSWWLGGPLAQAARIAERHCAARRRWQRAEDALRKEME